MEAHACVIREIKVFHIDRFNKILKLPEHMDDYIKLDKRQNLLMLTKFHPAPFFAVLNHNRSAHRSLH